MGQPLNDPQNKLLPSLDEGVALPRGVELRVPAPREKSPVLDEGALALVADLSRRFGWRVDELLARRRERQARFDSGERPDFLPETAHVRSSEWVVAPLPADLQDRRVEITGPTDRKMIINALNSGASVFMADFEDSNSPTWENLVRGQENLFDAVRGTIEYTAPEGKKYRLNERTAVLFVRPRGWHLTERHVEVDGRPVPAALFDFAVFFHHNAKELVRRGSGPYFYLPKLESHLEARLWNEVFLRAQEALGLPRGTVKATCLIETLPAAFEMHEILWELREHSAGLNCGRWDYIFSYIKCLRNDPGFVLPDRAQVTMDKSFLNAYVQLLIQTCHRRNAHAMGGMAAQIPVKDDARANEAALAKVQADKLREVRAGHDGTWVAHPGLVPMARSVFDDFMRDPNQIHLKREEVRVGPRELLAVAEGTRTEAGLRHMVRVSLLYLEAWLRGSGCVPIYGLMEDAATAEISRAEVWQWIRHGVRLENGTLVSAEFFRRVLAEELDQLHNEVGDRRYQSGKFPQARALFEHLATAPEFGEFLTLPAYEALLAEESGSKAAPLGSVHPAGPAAPHPDPRRWEGVVRSYSRAEVERLRGTVHVEHTLAQLGALRLWDLFHSEPYLPALGALTGNQAVQMVKAGLKAIYLSGWQVAADANSAGQTYPDQSLYPVDSVPQVVRRINRALQRADQIAHAEGQDGTHWFAPIVADAEAGFGGPLNAYELMKALIEAGAAAVHFEDQVASEKKCGHLGGKVLVPTSQFIRTLTAARLSADVLGVPTVLVARTDADSAKLLMSDVDPYDAPFIDRARGRTPEGFFHLRGGVECAIARAVAYAPYADLLWCETSKPDLGEARAFAEGVHEKFPGKMLAYNCSPSFNWRKNLDPAEIARFQGELGALGYKFQFVTLAGFHALNFSAFKLARDYRDRGMAAYSELQEEEFAAEKTGYTATRHQQEVGTGYFDRVLETVTQGLASTAALEGSTEQAQFTAGDRLSAAHRSMEKDHHELGALVARAQRAAGPAALGSALDELKAFLARHFEREERDQGIFGILAERGASEEADALLHEHRTILHELEALVRAVGDGLSAKQVGERARTLAGQLVEHERREHAMAERALSSQAATVAA
ncbi:MAG TPA: malate synthase A [Anaeromyxobacteraceae bacterium]|nr:malate synthase A [Anaeromyxobacteraceae bacterium]